MNNQDLLYNIALTITEVDDVMGALADRANSLSALQKKIYNQAIQQKQAFESYLSEASQPQAPEMVEEAQNAEAEPAQKTKKGKEEVVDGQE